MQRVAAVLGLLQGESGDSAAEKTLESIILLPDRDLSHHCSRLMRHVNP
jgi:hypothetical protein